VPALVPAPSGQITSVWNDVLFGILPAHHPNVYPEKLEEMFMELTVKPTRATREFAEVLTPEALAFVETLQRAFGERRETLLQQRHARQAEIDAGKLPDFRADTATVRSSEWRVSPIPADLQKRWVEITGPTDRKMVINALNSGANVFMADFEDANSPTWLNMVQGHLNLREAIERTLSFTSPEGKEYRLHPPGGRPRTGTCRRRSRWT